MTDTQAYQMAAIFLTVTEPGTNAYQLATIFSISPGHAYLRAPLELGNNGPLTSLTDQPKLGTN